MIGYSFLSVAEEEMSEAAVFYEAASPGFGEKFLADVQHTVDRLRTHPEVGVDVAAGLRRAFYNDFRSVSFTRSSPMKSLSSRSHITGVVLVTGALAPLVN